MLDFLPNEIFFEINKFNIKEIYEIRLRCNYEVLIFYKDRYVILKDNLIVKQDDLYYIINNITEHSLFAFNDEIKNGFLTTKDGVRLGICGQVVLENGSIKSITAFSSLNIRIPHDIDGCSDYFFSNIFNKDNINNTLIFSLPFMGKTTLVKDIIKKIDYFTNEQILIIDERGEFINVKGKNIDILYFSNKEFAFEKMIRVMSPQIIITDELMEEDITFIKKIIFSGIKIIATCHAESIDKVKNIFLKNQTRYFFS